MSSNILQVITNGNKEHDVIVVEVKNSNGKKNAIALLASNLLNHNSEIINSQNMESMNFQRRKSRLVYRVQCEIHCMGMKSDLVINTNVINISQNGICVENKSFHINVNDIVFVVFNDPEKTTDVRLKALVVNTMEERIGLKFIDPLNNNDFIITEILNYMLNHRKAELVDRRCGLRFPVQRECKISFAHMMPVKARIKDLSFSGISLTDISTPFKTGVETIVILPVSTGEVQICGQIVRNENNEMSIRFYDELESPLETIFNFRNELSLLFFKKVKEKLNGSLPSHIYPHYFHIVDSIPLSSDGTIDKDKLKELTFNVINNAKTPNIFNKDELAIKNIIDGIIERDSIQLFDQRQVIRNLPKDIINKYPFLQLLNDGDSEPLGNENNKKEDNKYYSLSHAQKRIWYAEKLFNNSALGNIVTTCKLPGDINIYIMENAINCFVEENDTCRIRILENESGPVQYIGMYEKFSVDFFDFTGEDGEQKCNKWINKIAKTTLYKANENLFYFALFLFPSGEYGLLVGLHHTIYDGESINILIARISDIYRDLENNNYSKPAETTSYIDYCKMENDYIQSNRFLESKEYWVDKLKTYTDQARLKSNDGLPDVTAKRTVSELSWDFTHAIRDFCNEHSISVFQFYIAVIYIYIFNLTDKKDIVIGTVFSNRFHKSIKKVLGMFVSTTPIRITLDQEHCDFLSFLKVVKKETFLAIRHQKYPFDILLSDLQKINAQSTDFIEVMFSYRMAETTVPFTWHPPGATLFPLLFEVTESGLERPLSYLVDYQTNLFSTEEIDAMILHINALIGQIFENPSGDIFSIGMTTEDERNKLLNEYNNTYKDYPEEKTIHGLFEDRVEQTPDKTAIVFEGKSLTYRELNERSNQLARHLIKKGIKPNSIVAVLLDRSIEMMVGIFGILKAGGAYLPIDPTNPGDRIEYLLKDSNAALLLTNINNSFDFEWIGEILKMDDPGLYCEDKSNVITSLTSKDLSYIIYTSGSTGNPKGVMIEHRSVTNILLALEKKYPLGDADSYLLKTNYTFDVSVAELFGWFIGTGRLVILSPGYEKEPEKILNIIFDQKITHINFVPSMFKLFLFYLENKKMCNVNSLKYIFVAGEAISPDIVKAFYALNTDIIFENIYGPTESTIYATSYPLGELKDQTHVPIGKPLPNIECYIVNKHNQLVPIGITGELCLGGVGLARGYLNRPELTEEKFIDNPFRPGEKMYKTGDKCRWLPDGNIEYLGRIDFQIKIRGYRVELGEIENLIRKHDDIKDVVVLAKEFEKNDIRLAAYIVGQKQTNVDINKLKQSLKSKLPDYMVPYLYAKIESIPLNQNGKVDRKALLKIPLETSGDESYIAPLHMAEKQIFDLWQKILGINTIGINDNFFELGGNSLKLIELSVRLNKMFQKEIQVIQLLQYPTIMKQAEYLTRDEPKAGTRSADGEKYENKIETTEIAVIGLAGRFPGAKNIDEYWHNLINGKEAITFFTDEELLEVGIDQETLNNSSYVKAKGILDDIDSFDAPFFNYTKNDALCMDPQMRIFHEVVYSALENAGYIPDEYDGKIGIFAGASKNFYWQQLLMSGQGDFSDNFPLMILNHDFISTRIAYKLNLRGPAYNLQTACSTSLVAVDVAAHALLNDDCDIALAGGVSVILPQRQGYMYKEGFTFSPDGHCRAFDQKAGGLVPGEGAGVVVLKRLDKALRDKDNIWGVIKGSAVNNDGYNKIGFTAPSISGQAEVIQNALKRAHVEPESITYIETHGTGTNLGDPVELAGLKEAFSTPQKQYCRIGSVKTNIGHLDAASGIAGFIKTLLMLFHKKVPPSLNYHSPNPKIDFLNSPFIVNDTLTEWKRKDGIPLRAGVSSFGIGGTNAHVIVEEAPSNNIKSEEISGRSGYKFLLLSAKTENALEQITVNLYEFLKEKREIDFNSLIYTLQVGRKVFDYRKAVICRNIHEAIEILGSDDHNQLIIGRKNNDKNGIADNHKNKAAELLNELQCRDNLDLIQLNELGKMWCEGIDVEWKSLYDSPIKRIPLPSYPFEKNIFSIRGIHELQDNISEKKSKIVKVGKNKARSSKKQSIDKSIPENITDVLCDVWKKSLGLSHIENDDNYFEVGGDSLLAIQIVHEINTQLNIKIAPHILLEFQTIENLSNEIKKIVKSQNSSQSLQTQGLVTLQKGSTDRKPLFLIHPVTGTVYIYRELIVGLSKEQPVYGIEVQGTHNGKKEPVTIKDMAEKYVDIICQVQPDGPYFIGGSSFGGCIAYEMALQLQKMNKTIGSIFMIDAPGPGTIIPGLNSDLEVLAYYMSYNNSNYDKSLKILSEMPEEERYDFFLKLRSVYNKSLFKDNDRVKLKESIKRTQSNVKVMQDYYKNLSSCFTGRVVYFSATIKSYLPVCLEAGWEGFFTGECKVYKVGGDHISINLPPQVNEIAGYIEKHINV